MDSRTTSATGLASSRGSRLFGKAACAVAALGIASGFAAWITDFDLAGWMQSPASANVAPLPPTTSFDDRFGSGSVRNSRVISYPWRTASRPRERISTPSSGTSKASSVGNRAMIQNVQPEQPALSAEAAVPMPRSRPAEASLH